MALGSVVETGVRIVCCCAGRNMPESILIKNTRHFYSSRNSLTRRRLLRHEIGKHMSNISINRSRQETVKFSSSTPIRDTDKSTLGGWFSKLKLHKPGSLEPEVDDSQDPLKKRYVYVTSCEDMWEEVPNGLTFDVAYLDSHPGVPYKTRSPVVMGIHGTPGSHRDLLPLLQPLVAQGCRVILPNLPGYGLTRGVFPGHDDCFTHSPEEHADLLAGFLTVIGIPRVDLLVGHSAGCYSVLELCSEYKGVQSAMFINPGVHEPYRSIQPYWFLKMLNRGWDTPMLRPFIKMVAYTGGITRGYWKVPPTNIITSIRATTNVDYENVIHNLVTLKERKFPSCVVFSDNDKRIDMSQFREYCELLGGSNEKVETFTSDTVPHSTHAAPAEFPRGVLLQGAGHYPLNRYPTVLMAELHRLLRHIGLAR